MNRKGFTLVELLAVIVILAIIALITIPIVLKTINNSEIEGEKQSIAGYARAIEDDVANYLMMNPGKSYNDYVTAFNTSVEKGEEPIDYKGNRVKCGPIRITDKGKLILTGCIVYKEGDQLTDEQKAKKNHYNYDGKNVELVQNNNSSTPSTYVEYKIGDEITVAGDQYYVIADSGINQDYVTALKAEPLTVDEINANKISSDGINYVNRYAYDYVGEPYEVGGYGWISYYSSDGCRLKYYYGFEESSSCENEQATNYDVSDIKHVVDNWENNTFKNKELKKIGKYTTRLIEYNDLMDRLGYDPSVNSAGNPYPTSSTPEWLYNQSLFYWTMTAKNDLTKGVWAFTNDGNSGLISYKFVGSRSAVRPVINVYKNKIQ